MSGAVTGFYKQLIDSILKVDNQDQRAEEESISIKLKTPPSLLKTAANGKIGQSLWVRGLAVHVSFWTDRLTWIDKEMERAGQR